MVLAQLTTALYRHGVGGDTTRRPPDQVHIDVLAFYRGNQANLDEAYLQKS